MKMIARLLVTYSLAVVFFFMAFNANAQYYRSLDYCANYTNYPECHVWVMFCVTDAIMECDVSMH